MVFVRLENGAEILFLGDTATMLDNARLARQRSRFVTTYYSRDDRGVVARQLSVLKDLMKAEPGVILVPGHDGVAIQSLIDRGALRQGFSGQAAAASAADNDREAT
jgi:glyoxylase-like metal-dependent hydrolase (beta-lactamase superfamily II)